VLNLVTLPGILLISLHSYTFTCSNGYPVLAIFIIVIIILLVRVHPDRCCHLKIHNLVREKMFLSDILFYSIVESKLSKQVKGRGYTKLKNMDNWKYFV